MGVTINDLTPITSGSVDAANDVLAIVDVTGNITNKITVDDLKGAMGVGGGSVIDVGTGPNSTVRIGNNNTASGYYDAVLGGLNNSATTTNPGMGIGGMAFIGGGNGNCVTGLGSVIVGGGNIYPPLGYQFPNCITGNGDISFIGGGVGNCITSFGGAIVGGCTNTISGCYSSIGGGRGNIINANYGTIGGGYVNCIGIESGQGTIAGGFGNCVNPYSSWGTIGGGSNNQASNTFATIAGGNSNVASGNTSIIGGGCSNTASGYCSTIGGGCGNTASGYLSAILGGKCNSINTCQHAMIVGSNINADRECATFVNNLSIMNIPTGSAGLPAGSVWRCTVDDTLRIVP